MIVKFAPLWLTLVHVGKQRLPAQNGHVKTPNCTQRFFIRTSVFRRFKIKSTKKKLSRFQSFKQIHKNEYLSLFVSRTTHARQASNLCPSRKIKVPICDEDEKVEKFVIKTTMPNVCKSEQFCEQILKVATYTSKVLYLGSLFVNYLFIKLFEIKDADVFVIEQTLFTNIFAVITGNGKKAPDDIKEHFKTFCDLTTLDPQLLKNLQGPSPSWPASLSRSDALDKIVANFTAIWEKYQPSDCDLKTLYSKPHLFFKWFNFLSKEVQKKVFIMEPQAAKVASKAYILRKLLEIPFAATLNRQKFSSLLEQILAAVNSDKPFLPGNNHRTSRHNRYP
ncbi:hypothetical protein BDF20DRAFT_838210 [Mycotypha africana]|uniref:uncharacterized protein n=1 Tax=Mycotypha africana TaxID=64632 RepID=UPI002301D08E|nr:uncharacterized protein BDF20DRAFT_838210 [Mycotypha africana]KAI8971939.1 hypothetical protein BDF20DRAFT_838210 [Mycotypha africana]